MPWLIFQLCVLAGREFMRGMGQRGHWSVLNKECK